MTHRNLRRLKLPHHLQQDPSYLQCYVRQIFAWTTVIENPHPFWATDLSNGILENSLLISASPTWWFSSCTQHADFWAVASGSGGHEMQPGYEVSHRQKKFFAKKAQKIIWRIKSIHIYVCISVYLCRHIYLYTYMNIYLYKNVFIHCQHSHILKLWEVISKLASLKQVRNESAAAIKVKLDLYCESSVEDCSNKHA